MQKLLLQLFGNNNNDGSGSAFGDYSGRGTPLPPPSSPLPTSQQEQPQNRSLSPLNTTLKVNELEKEDQHNNFKKSAEPISNLLKNPQQQNQLINAKRVKKKRNKDVHKQILQSPDDEEGQSSSHTILPQSKDKISSESRAGDEAFLFRLRQAVEQRLPLSWELLEEYIGWEREIHPFERKNVVKKHEQRLELAEELGKQLASAEAWETEVRKLFEKRRADHSQLEQPLIKQLLGQFGTTIIDDQHYRERSGRELDHHQKRLCVAENEANELRKKFVRANKIVEFYGGYVHRLYKLYSLQQDLFRSVFGGPDLVEAAPDLLRYARLDNELTKAEEWRDRVALAKFRWTNGRALLVQAGAQFQLGIQLWHDLELDVQHQKTVATNNHEQTGNSTLTQALPSIDFRSLYFAAAHARNLMMAACNNVNACNIYIGPIKLPYNIEEELSKLELTLANALTEGEFHTVLGLKRTMNVFQATLKKVQMLAQWFDRILMDTIDRDLSHVCNERNIYLRELRLELLRKKAHIELSDFELHVEHSGIPTNFLQEPNFDDDEKEDQQPQHHLINDSTKKFEQSNPNNSYLTDETENKALIISSTDGIQNDHKNRNNKHKRRQLSTTLYSSTSIESVDQPAENFSSSSSWFSSVPSPLVTAGTNVDDPFYPLPPVDILFGDLHRTLDAYRARRERWRRWVQAARAEQHAELDRKLALRNANNTIECKSIVLSEAKLPRSSSIKLKMPRTVKRSSSTTSSADSQLATFQKSNFRTNSNKRMNKKTAKESFSSSTDIEKKSSNSGSIKTTRTTSQSLISSSSST